MAQAKRARGRGATQRAAGSATKIHSIAALQRERGFRGSFDVHGASYAFDYAPARAEVVEGKLQLVGRLTITGPNKQTHSRDDVRATLEATQGGVGASPARRQLLAAGAQSDTAATAEEKQQLASDNDKRPNEPAKTTRHGLPLTESAGSEAFCGAMYFRLEPLDSRALGVNADLSRVQLNARLAPTSDTEHALQDLFSAAVEALYGARVNGRLATAALAEINKLLAG
ncbi:MAG TPA: hypothetical protein VKA60_20595 [Blastocatellia bacterium]|nr:hypothetical protein [Blastocatellia bacterium]